MSVLSAIVIAQLVTTPACSVPGMVPSFWPAVIQRESNYDPLALHDDTDRRSYYPTTTDAAEKLALQLMAMNHSVGVGLAQLTAHSQEDFQRRFGISVRQALIPCTNLRAGSEFFVHGALSTYNAGSPSSPAGQRYARSVMQAASIAPVVQNPPTPPEQMTEHRVTAGPYLHPSQSRRSIVLPR